MPEAATLPENVDLDIAAEAIIADEEGDDDTAITKAHTAAEASMADENGDAVHNELTAALNASMADALAAADESMPDEESDGDTAAEASNSYEDGQAGIDSGSEFVVASERACLGEPLQSGREGLGEPLQSGREGDRLGCPAMPSEQGNATAARQFCVRDHEQCLKVASTVVGAMG